MPGGIGLANPQFPYKSYFDPIGEAAPSPYIYDVTTKNQFALRSFKDNVGNCFTDMVLMSDGADSTSTFRLFTNTPEGNAVERMSILNTGTARFTGAIDGTSVVATGTITSSDKFVHSTGATTDSGFLGESPGFTTDHYVYTRAIVNESETGTGPAAIVFGNGATYGNDQISLITDGATRMYFKSDGNIGIGTTNPTHKLEVNGNFSTQGVTVTGPSSQTSGGITINNVSPTLFLQDTDANSAMIHCNSNLLYVLRGATNSKSWVKVNNEWPLIINLTNNDATFGGNLYVKGGYLELLYQKISSSYQTYNTGWTNIPLTSTRGAFFVMVQGASNDVSCAIFACTDESNFDTGIINVVSRASDWNNSGAYFDLRWNGGANLQIRHTTRTSAACHITVFRTA